MNSEHAGSRIYPLYKYLTYVQSAVSCLMDFPPYTIARLYIYNKKINIRKQRSVLTIYIQVLYYFYRGRGMRNTHSRDMF